MAEAWRQTFRYCPPSLCLPSELVSEAELELAGRAGIALDEGRAAAELHLVGGGRCVGEAAFVVGVEDVEHIRAGLDPSSKDRQSITHAGVYGRRPWQSPGIAALPGKAIRIADEIFAETRAVAVQILRAEDASIGHQIDRLARLEELEAIRSGPELSAYSKKAQSALNREYRKMYRNLNGLRLLNRLPECIVVVDPKKEKNAIHEARKLGITTVALIDTDCNPDLVDLPIPGNDDGIRSIEIIIRHLADAIAGAKAVTGAEAKDQEVGDVAMAGAAKEGNV